MDSDGWITLAEAAALPSPYQPPYDALPYDALPYDAEILRNAVAAGALRSESHNGCAMTRPEWVQEWGRNLKITLAAVRRNLFPLSRESSGAMEDRVEEILEQLPPGSGQRDLERALLTQQATPPPYQHGSSPAARHMAQRSHPTPIAIESRVRKLLNTRRIIDSTVEAAFPHNTDNPGRWAERVVWCLKHERHPDTLTYLSCKSWDDWKTALTQFGVTWGSDPSGKDGDSAMRRQRDLCRRMANARYLRALEESLDDADTLERVWGFGIPNTPEGFKVDRQEWLETPQEEAERYIPEIRRQLLSSRRQSDPYRAKAKAAAGTLDKEIRGSQGQKQSDSTHLFTDMTIIDIIDSENSLVRSRGNWVWTHQIPENGD